MLAFRLLLAVLLLPLVATVLVCGLAFSALYLVGNRYSLEQVQGAAAVHTLLWFVVLAIWAVRVWRRAS